MINKVNIRTAFSYADCERIAKAIRKGEIYYADLSGTFGSEQGGMRPVLIIQNDIGNKYSPTTIIVPITSRLQKADLPTHLRVGSECGLLRNSIILFEQVRTIDKRRIGDYIGALTPDLMEQANEKLKVSFGT